jgi:hypothetical protein
VTGTTRLRYVLYSFCPCGPMRFSRAFGAVACAAILLASGCTGDRLPLATVEGTVTYKGKALDHGMVSFNPESGTRSFIGIGVIQADGSFRIQTVNRDGAVVGRHTVTIQCRRPPTPQEERQLVVTESLIPEKYGRVDVTPLHLEVNAGKNYLPITLE